MKVISSMRAGMGVLSQKLSPRLVRTRAIFLLGFLLLLLLLVFT